MMDFKASGACDSPGAALEEQGQPLGADSGELALGQPWDSPGAALGQPWRSRAALGSVIPVN